MCRCFTIPPVTWFLPQTCSKFLLWATGKRETYITHTHTIQHNTQSIAYEHNNMCYAAQPQSNYPESMRLLARFPCELNNMLYIIYYIRSLNMVYGISVFFLFACNRVAKRVVWGWRCNNRKHYVHVHKKAFSVNGLFGRTNIEKRWTFLLCVCVSVRLLSLHTAN